jgi:predicted transcriptional regulator
MPLLEVTQIRHISASIRLTDTTATQVDQYAAFIEASADDVIEQALTYVFSKDRDFQEFLKTSQAGHVTPTLRIRKGPNNDAAEPPAMKPTNGVRSTAQPPVVADGLKA